MTKWCLNYDSGEYEYIDKDGYSIDRGEYVYNWDDSDYRREEEEERRLFDDEDDDQKLPLRNFGSSAAVSYLCREA